MDEKRTARKNAARLAAEQALTDAALAAGIEPLGEAVETEETGLVTTYADAAEAVLVPGPEAPADVAAPAEAAEAVAAPATHEAEAPLVSPPVDEATTAAEAEELTTLPASAAAPNRRGTGPTPKKSRVIAKSAPVKQPKRTTLFRGAAAATEAAPEAVAQAPLISTPIIPEMLLERPAVPELLENPAALAAETAAAKPRRGRPKKAAEPPVAPAVAGLGEVALAPDATPTAETPEAAPVAEAAAAKPARVRRAPKPAATGEAAPRRGRPPGKKAAPEA